MISRMIVKKTAKARDMRIQAVFGMDVIRVNGIGTEVKLVVWLRPLQNPDSAAKTP